MFNIKQSLLCISAISCMSLYADPIDVNKDIIIGDSTKCKEIATGLKNTAYNKWEDSNTYVFNASSNNKDTSWRANKQVTIDTDYTLKLITNYTNGDYYIVLNCYNTFTNYGNVIIDGYGRLDLNFSYTNNNDGTIDIINGKLGLFSATLNNNTNGTITLTDSSYIYITNSSALTNEGTITLEDSSYIDIYNSDTLTNTGTIDISNITDLSKWSNDSTFTLEGGSTFILPKSILADTNKINKYKWEKPITLKGTKDNPVNIKIPKECAYINDIDKHKDKLFEVIQEKTGFTFGKDNRDNVEFSLQQKENVDQPTETSENVEFSWHKEDEKQPTETSIDNECEISYVDEC